MALDIVPGTEVQTQVGGATISPQAFRAAALSKGSTIAGAGQDIANLFNTVSAKLQDVKNTKSIIDADNAIVDFNQKAQENIFKQYKPEDWSNAYNQQFKEFSNGLMAAHPEYGPDVRNHIQGMLSKSQMANDINVRTASSKRILQDTAKSLEYGMNVAVNTYPAQQATEKYMLNLQIMKDKGILDQAEYDLRVQQAPKIIDEGQFKQAIITNPIHTFELMQQKDKNGNYTYLPNLQGQDRDKAMNEARARSSEKQTLNGEQLQNEIAKTPAYLIDRKKVQSMANNNEITQQRANGIMNSFSKQDAKLEMSMLDQLKAQVTTYDFKNDLWPSVKIAKLKDQASGLSPKLFTEFNQFIDSYVKKQRQPEVSEENTAANALKAQAIKEYNESAKSDLFNIPLVLSTKKEVIKKNSFWFDTIKETPILAPSDLDEKTLLELKNDPKKLHQLYGEDATWEDLKFAVNEKQAKDLLAIERWFAPSNPDRLNIEKTAAFKSSLKAPWAMEKTKNALRGIATPEIQTAAKPKTDYQVGKTYTDANNNKAVYMGNGQWMTVPTQ